jgi:glutathione S-transferase
MKLYFAPMTRALRPRWLLEEIGVPYELVTVDVRAGEGKRAEHLARHPHGRVPALTDGALTLIESSAICMYLADRFADKRLAPEPGTPERGLYYQWMVYAVATAEAPTLELFFKRKPEAELVEARRMFDEVGRYVESVLADDRPFILGERFSAADVMLGSVFALAQRAGLTDALPSLHAYAQRLVARPAFARARSE